MEKEQFLKQVSEIQEKFYNEIHTPLVKLVQELENPSNTLTCADMVNCLKKLDDMALLTAWVYDKAEGKNAIVGTSDYRGSYTKKIRKALGYYM